MELIRSFIGLEPGSLAEWAGVAATLLIALVSGVAYMLRSRRSAQKTRGNEKKKPTSEAATGAQSDTSFSTPPAAIPQEAANTRGASRRARLEVTWASRNSLILRNLQDTPLAIEYVRNRNEFVRLDLQDLVTLAPGRSIRCTVIAAMQRPMPDELVLDIVGEDSPLVVAFPPRPSK